MNKGQQFWVELWREGRAYFHKKEVNPDLIRFWPSLNIAKNATILVPLCGKSVDMLWLSHQGYNVIGIELSEEAVKQFGMEQRLDLQQEKKGQTSRYCSNSISIWVADIFELDPSFIVPVDAIYDRAALIALPEKLRSNYVDICLQWLKPQGAILLKTLSYNQSEMEGPPYSVSDDEIVKLYNKQCLDIQCIKGANRLKDDSDILFQRGLEKIKDSVWSIRKK